MRDLEELFNDAIIDNPTVFMRWDGEEFVRGVGVSASELWTCARQTFYKRHKVKPDDSHEENYGFFERGHSVEERIVYRMHQAMPKGWELLYAGSDQKTLVHGNVSATPDGVFRPKDRAGEVAPLLLPGGQVLTDDTVLEIKSMDPRANMSEPKAQHVAQAKLQIELYRVLGIAQPTGALLLCVDASDYSKKMWHYIERDTSFLDSAMTRAGMIIGAKKAMDLDPEGIWDGGCGYCAYKKTCGEAVLRHVPLNEVELNTDDAEEMQSYLFQREFLSSEVDEATAAKIRTEEDARKLLRKAGTNVATIPGYKISYRKQSGRKSLMKDELSQLLESQGLDLDDYYTEGEPSARLTVTKEKEKKK